MKREKKLRHRALISILIFALPVLLVSCTEDPDIDTVLNTIQVNNADITSSTANLQGAIEILGTKKIVEYGIQLSANFNYSTYTDKKVTTAPAVGQFTVEFTGLNPGTIYYYRAYAIVNTAHIYAPNPLQFTTKAK